MLVGGGFAFATTEKLQSPTHYNVAEPNKPAIWLEIPDGKEVSSCDNANRECTGVMLGDEIEPTSQRGFATLSDI